jgi:hypothetical protein
MFSLERLKRYSRKPSSKPSHGVVVISPTTTIRYVKKQFVLFHSFCCPPRPVLPCSLRAAATPGPAAFPPRPVAAFSLSLTVGPLSLPLTVVPLSFPRSSLFRRRQRGRWWHCLQARRRCSVLDASGSGRHGFPARWVLLPRAYWCCCPAPWSSR